MSVGLKVRLKLKERERGGKGTKNKKKLINTKLVFGGGSDISLCLLGEM